MRPIKIFSYYAYEEELLYAPNTAFRVTGLYEPTSFNLRQGVKLASGGLFQLNTDQLSQGKIGLEEARKRKTLLITMVEQRLDPDIDVLTAQDEILRRRQFEVAHNMAHAGGKDVVEGLGSKPAGPMVVGGSSTMSDTSSNAAPPSEAAPLDGGSPPVWDEYAAQNWERIEAALNDAVDTALTQTMTSLPANGAMPSTQAVLMRISSGLLSMHMDMEQEQGAGGVGVSSSVGGSDVESPVGGDDVPRPKAILYEVEKALTASINKVMEGRAAQPLCQIALDLLRQASEREGGSA